MSRQTHEQSAELWAITAFFNPCCFHSRYSNYLMFHRNIKVPLLTVELSFGTAFQLSPSDATKLIQISSDDVMWQKERLLNVALQALPPQCRKVAWLDCDILFQRADWPSAACLALERFSLVQLFSTSRSLRQTVDHAKPLAGQSCVVQDSLVTGHLGVDKQPSMPSLSAGRRLVQGLPHSSSPGFAWAMRKEDLSVSNLYDGLVVGGGDYAMAMAALGRAPAFANEYELSDVRKRHYLEWADGFHRVVEGNLGMVEGDVYHFWHGSLEDRQYDSRHDILRRHEFDPYRDIVVDPAGCWRWSSDKPALHADVKAFFNDRKEDSCGKMPSGTA